MKGEDTIDMRGLLASALIVCGISFFHSLGLGVSASPNPEVGAKLTSSYGEEPEATYRIKPKDELDIRIEGACIYSTRFVVDERGFIEMPFAGEVRAAGKTVAELVFELASELKKYMKDPKVHVRVMEGRT
jgi:protein involved in polysaccharide export with SLBB domain